MFVDDVLGVWLDNADRVRILVDHVGGGGSRRRRGHLVAVVTRRSGRVRVAHGRVIVHSQLFVNACRCSTASGRFVGLRRQLDLLTHAHGRVGRAHAHVVLVVGVVVVDAQIACLAASVDVLGLLRLLLLLLLLSGQRDVVRVIASLIGVRRTGFGQHLLGEQIVVHEVRLGVRVVATTTTIWTTAAGVARTRVSLIVVLVILLLATRAMTMLISIGHATSHVASIFLFVASAARFRIFATFAVVAFVVIFVVVVEIIGGIVWYDVLVALKLD